MIFLSFVSKCSTSCSIGKRTRVVTCITHDAPCDLSEKPETHEICDLGPCLAKSTPLSIVSANLQSPQWLFTEWSEQVIYYYSRNICECVDLLGMYI